ncbi:MAG TPA: hypothetical protein VNJ52_13755 [Patescibacteria group bacterium]|nr:hypothetical protein [Patescibacteria group bacterium]
MRLGSLKQAKGYRVVHAILLAMFVALVLSRCGTAGGSPSSNPPPPPPTITVSVSPATAAIFLGNQQQMTASVTGTSNAAVTWSVNGVSGGDSTTGTITPGGLYTAPSTLPSSANVTITATSQADSAVAGTAAITIESGVQVTISPTSATVTAGASQQFIAQVTGSGSPSTAVNWSLTGGACAAGCGTLTTSGNTATYTAPATVPAPATVSVVGVSVADPSKSATADVTITSGQTCSPAVSVSPAAASVALGAQQSFSASVCFSTNQNVTWTISGSGCTGANCGTVNSTTGNTAIYTAPASQPPANPVTLIATSAADASQSGSASITITSSCSPAVSISPSAATVALGQQQSFTASVCSSTNQSVNWSVTGSGCSGTACGTVSSTGANTATYTAPASLPPASPVTLVATSAADPSQSASAAITVVSGISVTLAPIAAEVALNRRTTLTPTVEGSSDTAVTWTVNGVANGNATVGEICVAGSNPCAAPGGALPGAVEYLAPASLPSPAGVYVVATSDADPSRGATAEMTVVGHLVLGVWPASAVIAPSGTVEFASTVIGSGNTGVSWQASCASGSCGTISTSGVYTAPAAAPSPNAITVTATSQDDPAQTATATVALSSAVAIESLAPASVTAGEADNFTLLLAGMSFTPTSPGPGSTVTIDGTARATTCASATACTVTIAPADVASAGTLIIQAQNPGGTLSNSLPLVVVPADGPADVISLSPSQPVAGSRNITAVEPTTAGSGTGPMTVLFVGLVDTSTNTCNVNESPITLAIPSSGTAAYTICLGGSALDPSYTYAIAGSQASDGIVSNSQAFAGALVELKVTVSSTAAPGPRAIVVTDPGEDRAVASGAIDVE